MIPNWRYVMWIIVAVLALLFLLVNSDFDFNYIIPTRFSRLSAIFVAGVCIALSSVIFQTVSGNRILTPAVMGYEAVYLLFQALLILVLGSQSLVLTGYTGNAVLSLLLMLLYSWIIHLWLFRNERNNVHLQLLSGLVLTMVLGVFTQFIQLKISPGEFSVLQGFSYASFNRAQPQQLLYSILLVALTCIVAMKTLPILDVLTLGRDQAISLGVDYQKNVRLQFSLIAVLVAVSTSLVGPTAFMGVFVANVTYTLAKATKHCVTLPLSCAIAISMFIAAQFLVEQVFNYNTSVSILINLVCGVYFLALIIRNGSSL